MKAMIRTLALFTLAVVAVGCGGSGYTVKGRLEKNGTPITVSDKGVVQLSFVPESSKEGGTPYPATVEKDGSFVINGRGTDTGIPAGKYRVNVAIVDPYPGNDKLGGKFNGPNSPLVKDITGSGSIVVDIEKDAKK
jgi:hypothetical protein